MNVMRGRRGWCELVVLVVLAVLASTPAARAEAQPQPDPPRALAVEPRADECQVPDCMPADDGDTAPKFALDDAPIRAWIEAHKGFGAPDYFDSAAAAPDVRVLVAWNIPTSGVNGTDFWIYCRAETAGWTLLESGYFQPREDQAHSTVLDTKTDEVRFLGRDGEVYHRVSVTGCRWKRP